MKNVVITGGTGLIGKALTKLLYDNGYNVIVLTRNRKLADTSGNFSFWNVETKIIDKEIILKANHIIHLAGEGIADKMWNNNRKKQIEESRIAPLKLIYNVLKDKHHNVKTIVSASGINIYGLASTSKSFYECDKPADDFLAKVCIAWENAVDEFANLDVRVVKLRTGIVLSKHGGALPKMVLPFKFGLGAFLGSGKQYLPWISLNDLCRLYLFAIENCKMQGAYNAVIDDETTNKIFSQTIAKVLNKRIWLPNIPSIFIKIMLGEMSVLLLNGNKVSNKKVKEAGFSFINENLEMVLSDFFKVEY